MRPPWLSGLRIKFLMLVLFAVTPAMGLTLYAGITQRQTAASSVREDSMRLVQMAAMQQVHLVEGAHVLLTALARLPEVHRKDPSACSAQFAELEQRYPLFINLGVADVSGDVFCSAVPLTGLVNIADRDYFKGALRTQGFSIGGYQIGRITGRRSLNAGYPVMDPSGQVHAIVFVAMDLAWFSRLAAELALPEGAALNVLDRSGTILARYPDPEKWVGNSLPDAPIVETVLTEEEGTTEVTGIDGIARIYAYTPLVTGPGQSQAYVAIGIPKSVAYADVRRLLRDNLIGLGLILIAGSGLALFVAERSVLRTIDALAEASSRLQAGDLTARSGLAGGRDEVCDMARAFDDMAEALETRAAEAEASRRALTRYADRLTVLHDIDRAILSHDSSESIAQAALEHIGRLVPCRRASIGRFDFDTNSMIVLATMRSPDIPAQAGTRVPLGAMRASDQLMARLRDGKASLVDLHSVDPTSPLTKAALAAGIRYVEMIPMVVDGELIGSLSLVLDPPGAPPADYLEIAREVADQVAVGIHQADLKQQLRRHADQLEQQVGQRTIELKEAVQAADRANQAKSEFLSRMSHELRTPLNAILGFGQLLEMDSLNPEQQESVGHILKAGRHLLELINDLLDIARIEAGRLPVSVEPVLLRTVVEEAVDFISLGAAERNIKVYADKAIASNLYVLADRQRLRQVLLNLLSNAVKYNRRGGTIAVFVEALPEGRVRTAITDTGVGIAPERLDGVFTAFERLGADELGVEGSGLGLMLAKGLTEAMGGTLGVESAVGQGSTFWVDLARAEVDLDNLEISPGSRLRADGVPSGKTRTVLCIEDNHSNLRLVENLLAHRPGVQLLSAMQGRMGLGLAREHRPDLILLDLHLPDIHGDKVLRELQATPETSQIPVVVISADATAGQADRLLSAGARAYLTKPLDMKACLDLFDDILNGRAESDAGRRA